MCGITGLFDTRGHRQIDAAALRRMNDAQHHRGPDEGSIHIEPGVGFGHRRLSIIDIATGQQPLPRGAKRFVDDGSSFWARAGMAAITHGPQGGGAHTLEEWISIPELVRVAKLYAAIAVEYCAPNA